jgi:hypothetical protein
VIARSEKQEAAPTWKKTFGFHPLAAFADHGAGGNGEPLAIVLRAGSAGSNTAAGHIEATRLALAQLPRHLRRKALIRTGSGGGTHGFLEWLTARSRRLHYSAGMTITQDMQEAILKVPAGSWTTATATGRSGTEPGSPTSPGCWDLSSWPAGMRVIVRKERPHPGAQLRFSDLDGHRFTAFATDAAKGQLSDLELRHRRRARCEDRIRCAKDTGLRNLPLKGFAQNQLWCEIVALACELLAWTQISPWPGPPAAGNPDACGCASLNAGRGPARSPLQSPGCRPCRQDDQTERSLRIGRRAPGPVEPRLPSATAGQPALPALENQPQPNPSGEQITDAKDRG